MHDNSIAQPKRSPPSIRTASGYNSLVRSPGWTTGRFVRRPGPDSQGGRHVRHRSRPRRRLADGRPRTHRQVRQAEELLFSEPAGRGSPRPCSGASSAATSLFPYPELPDAERAERRRRPSRRSGRSPTRTSTPPRSTARPTSPGRVIEGLAELGVLGMTAPGGVRRPRVLAVGLLPDHGGHRRPLLVDGRLRQRPPLDRHPGPAPLRHARAEGALAARRWPAARSSRRSP